MSSEVLGPGTLAGLKAVVTGTSSGIGRAVAARLALRPGVEVPAGTLLLVDDTWRTGWTATIAAAVLREAGAVAVAPLVAHQLP